MAENYLKKSGIDFTIVRPGGLKAKPPTGALQISGEDTLNSGEISRDLVADVCVASLTDAKASNKVLGEFLNLHCTVASYRLVLQSDLTLDCTLFFFIVRFVKQRNHRGRRNSSKGLQWIEHVISENKIILTIFVLKQTVDR